MEKNSYRFFENKECMYYPCHAGMEGKSLNCLFCYCPMHPYPDCLGKPVFRENKNGRIFKDCTGCVFPHDPQNYETILAFLKEKLYAKQEE